MHMCAFTYIYRTDYVFVCIDQPINFFVFFKDKLLFKF